MRSGSGILNLHRSISAATANGHVRWAAAQVKRRGEIRGRVDARQCAVASVRHPHRSGPGLEFEPEPLHLTLCWLYKDTKP